MSLALLENKLRNNMNSIGIFLNRFTNTKDINLIKDYYQKDNLFFVYDDLPMSTIADTDGYGVINLFNVRFTNTKILLLSCADLETVHDYTNKKLLVIKKEELSKLNMATIDVEQTEILFIEPQKIRKPRNAELQSVFR